MREEIKKEAGYFVGYLRGGRCFSGLCLPLALMLVMGSLLGCQPQPPQPPEVLVTVTPAAATVEAGLEVTLSASSTSAEDTSFTWTSGSPGVATVDNDGVVTGVAEGEATISATGSSSGVIGQAVISVVPGPDVLAVPVGAAFADPLDPNDGGWNSEDMPSLVVETAGSPILGGHGATGNNPSVKQMLTGAYQMQIKAAYTDDRLYMRFLWNDSTRNDDSRRFVYDAASDSWSRTDADEDRLYVQWPIVDGPGREGFMFNDVGCGMTCHPRAEQDRNTLAFIDASVRLDDCSACHTSPGATTLRFPPFEHPRATSCAGCHSEDYANVSQLETTLRGASNGGDMIAPANTAYDIWHWKAQRSNPIGVAEDQFTANTRRRARDMSNLAPDNVVGGGVSAPRFIWVDDANDLMPILRSAIDANSVDLAMWNADTNQYENLATGEAVVLNDGKQVQSNSLRDDLLADDPSANVLAMGDHDGTTWAVVLSRELVSDDPVIDVAGMNTKTDFDFNTAQRAQFSVAYTDNTGTIHHGYGGPLELGFR